MDGETLKILLALAGGGLSYKIIDKVLDFVKGQRPVFNGQTTLITKILEQQTEILKDIREANRENGKKLDAVSGNLTLAMGRQADFYAEQRGR